MKNRNVFSFDKHSKLQFEGKLTLPVKHALEMLLRDMGKLLGKSPDLTYTNTGSPAECTWMDADLVIGYCNATEPIYGRDEAYSIRFLPGENGDGVLMKLTGSDELGIIYGLLYISREYLGVDPFWFWADKEPVRRDTIEIEAMDYIAEEPNVRFRGWFVNDEVCLIGWTEVYPPPREVWIPVFEALLRCGGNMVIPGTDLPRNGVQWDLAQEMGLYVTHHHAEPLGAEMFFRAYPYQEASYDLNGPLFEGLWMEAIKRQKGKKVVWILGFRGQGDCPFWLQDPACSTPERRGELIGRVIRRQFDLVTQHLGDQPCATYLYGEITELYRAGLIDIPDGVIKIWADNGYGKMVSRRQGNHNPRISALPDAMDKKPHGLYYHITFHDLQASNHLVMFPATPTFVCSELEEAFQAGADRYLLLNCGNIRPHILFLDLVRELWTKGSALAVEHLDEWCGRYFAANKAAAKACYRDYFETTVQYGKNPDEKAGEEFFHHPVRSIIGHWMRGELHTPAEDLLWAADTGNFSAQVEWFFAKCDSAADGWKRLRERCEAVCDRMDAEEAVFFQDHLLFQVILHDSGCRGFISACRSFFEYMRGNYPLSFVHASESLWQYKEGLAAMERSEHGKWRNFYRADWLTNIKSTLYSLDAVRKYIRMHGDNPDYFHWSTDYLLPESEKKIYLENTHRNPLTDDELATRLKQVFSI